MADHRQAGSLWTPEEDVVLLRHVAKYGTKHWGYLQTSGILPHRDQKACCNRFILLKRKFFQARAKGQRLTFPVVPQPEPVTVPGSLSSSPPRSASPSPTLLKAAPVVGVKRAAESAVPGPSAARAIQKPRLVANGFYAHHSSLSDSLKQEPPRVFVEVQSSMLARTMDSLQEKPMIVRHDSGITSALQQMQSVVTGCRSPPTTSLGDRVTKPLPDIPSSQAVSPECDLPRSANHRASRAPLTAVGSLDSSSALRLLDSAVWRCFNPNALEPPAGDAGEQVVTSGTGGGPASGGEGAGSPLAPDALLDQIASDPVKMLFGGSQWSGPMESHLDGVACCGDVSAAWPSSSAGCIDLWEFMRTPAM